MTSSEEWRFVLVGTGNVAWHMGHALIQNGFEIIQVLGRNVLSARQLSKELDIEFSGGPKDLNPDANACLICVSDDAILPVLKELNPGNCLVMHTAGSVSMDVFNGLARNYGVMYPLQTFTKNRPLLYENIPLLVEANTSGNLQQVRKIAGRISDTVTQADSLQRLNLHLAAVFANNFSNHMFALAETLTREHGLSFELLKPLIEETAAKAVTLSPLSAQTGPAFRENTKIMEKHLELLRDQPGLQELYRLISENIRQIYRHSPF